MREQGSHSYAAMRISRRSGILTRQGNRAMMKNLVLAASMTMLIALSGQALAGTATANERYRPEATAPSGRQTIPAFNASDRAMATQTVEPNAHRYHGGPKSND
jgi:hypothetical protein